MFSTLTRFAGPAFGAAALMAAALFAGGAANAAPAAAGAGSLLAAQGQSLVTLTAGGCGRGFVRARNGRCVRQAPAARRTAPAPRRMAPPPRHVRTPPPPRRCFMQHTPRGPVRVCR